jgi:methyl-accepting chemotaxis protein
MMHDGLRAVAFRAVLSSQTQNADDAKGAKEELKEFTDNMNTAFEGLRTLQKDLGDKVSSKMKTVEPDVALYTKGTQEIVTAATAAGANPADTQKLLPKFQEDFERLEKSLGEFGELIEKTTNDAVAEKNANAASAKNLALVIMLIGLAVGLVASVAVTRIITSGVGDLAVTAEKIGQGDNTARAKADSLDEIGVLGKTFNTMVEARNAAQEKIEKENRQLQDGIQHLLMVMSDASDGNMVVRAKVTEGALGNVADAMNLMLENVGDLIKNAKKVSGKVATAAAEINQSATDLADGSVKQTDQLNGASVGAKELSTEALAVTEACKQATKAAAQSEEAADRGAKIVREVIAGMEKIRESVQVNGKKIKRLGERSMEIGGILKTINEISAQTDMLALNASIEAGRAGEAGRGFSAVAEQVRALAERAKLATQQVEKLVGDIQQETAEAVAQTETQTQQVENGAQKVAQAGEALNDIVSVSTQSRDAVTKIASTAEQQAAKTGQMLTAVAGAASIAADSRNKVGGARLSAEQLAQFAKDLDKQLDQFKVSAN